MIVYSIFLSLSLLSSLLMMIMVAMTVALNDFVCKRRVEKEAKRESQEQPEGEMEEDDDDSLFFLHKSSLSSSLYVCLCLPAVSDVFSIPPFSFLEAHVSLSLVSLDFQTSPVEPLQQQQRPSLFSLSLSLIRSRCEITVSHSLFFSLFVCLSLSCFWATRTSTRREQSQLTQKRKGLVQHEPVSFFLSSSYSCSLTNLNSQAKSSLSRQRRDFQKKWIRERQTVVLMPEMETERERGTQYNALSIILM